MKSKLVHPRAVPFDSPQRVLSPARPSPSGTTRERLSRRFAYVAKRAVDLAGATLMIIALSPFLVALMVLISLDSPGGPFFAQPRVGRHGRIFRILKFRTMRPEAPRVREALVKTDGAERLFFKMKGDPRVTRLGRFLRKYSLDELPQLVNVVRGEMSLVGPRPLLLEDFESTSADFTGYDDWVRERHLFRPGLSGLWQVSGRSHLSFEDSMRADLTYVRTWSLGRDAVILLRTPAAVLRGTD